MEASHLMFSLKKLPPEGILKYVLEKFPHITNGTKKLEACRMACLCQKFKIYLKSTAFT